MIGKLKGAIDSIEEDYLILDVNGVGYLVYCPNSMLSSCKPQDHVTLITEMIVKEDSITLYGFLDSTQKQWFKLLQTVQGVGARMALAILSLFDAEQLSHIILSQDYTSLKRVSGVGGKLASRIINELQNKESLTRLSNNSSKTLPTSTHANSTQEPTTNILNDALSGLSNLGFNRSDAYKVLNDVLKQNPEYKLEELIREGLAKISKK